MENKNKIRNLFNYIMQIYSQKQQVVTNIKDHEWFLSIADIPEDSECIKINYKDKNNDINNKKEEDYENNFLLEVQKVDYELPPKLIKDLEEWVEEDWQDFDKELRISEKKIKIINEKEEIENFSDNPKRVEAFKKFSSERELWAQKQRVIERKRALFNQLYSKYIDLNRDSETLEMMIGQGFFKTKLANDKLKNIKEIDYPILLKKVNISFDALNNIIRIVDTDLDEELNTMLLQAIDSINHSAIKILKEDLEDNFYHPLDRIETIKFLKTLAHSLNSESKYIDSFEEVKNTKENDKIVIYNNPVFFIRKKPSGVVKAIEEIIKQLEENDDISAPLLNLVGENIPLYKEEKKDKDIDEILSEINGEDRDILLIKEANREQLEIAKRIENYNAILVQGPPGTGKTHSIANLIGHFLAQGKNILVTSHTKKALSVVKDKLSPELQNLCISVLDDNNKDMEKSVDGISEYIASHSSFELEKNIDELSTKRNKILTELNSIRKNMYEAKLEEFKDIIYSEKSYSIVEAAKYVYNNKEKLSYIPGEINIKINKSPLLNVDIEFLYKSNALLSLEEEREIGKYLPDLSSIIKPEDFEILISNEKVENTNKEKIINKLNRDDIKFDYKKGEFLIEEKALLDSYNEDSLKFLKNFLELNMKSVLIENNKLEDWVLFAIMDGQKGGTYKVLWEKFIQKIELTYNCARESKIYLLGKEIKIEKEISIISSNQIIKILKEMKEHVAKGKKVNSFSFFKPKEWLEIYENIKINNNSLESIEDYNAVISNFELTILRDELSRMWYELIEKNGGKSFKAFGEEKEEELIKYAEKIKKLLTWYDDIYGKTKELLKEAHINFELLIKKEDFIYNLDELRKVLKTLYIDLYMCIDFLIAINSNTEERKRKIEYENTKESLSNPQVQHSKISSDILKALLDNNIENYKIKYEELLKLIEKNELIKNRLRILNIIENVAPEWADQIRNRIGIHGEKEFPFDIDELWKIKFFEAHIKNINLSLTEDLNLKIKALGKELKKVTNQLVENLAWYKLFEHIEKDVSLKQALQGWKLTVKKIGKGTGKRAPALKREAKKLMAKCQAAVPAWVMPINKALENLDPKTNKFDIVIVDEASQSDISALAILYFAKKIIIVGDDEQVSPSAVGIDIEKIDNLLNMYIKNFIPNWHLYDMKSSLYDIAKTTFPSLMLKEHFRCVPSIIGYSNRLSYDYKIKALRDDSLVPVKPATISYQVLNGKRDDKKKVNEEEAKMIVALMKACIEFDEYKNMSFGAISLLGDEQAEKINKLAIEKIAPLDFEQRRILCGNASQFQGDERDVIFISLVDSNDDNSEKQLRLASEGAGKAIKQRYNVAVSRAKNQLWLVHSLDIEKDLKLGDMRRDLIEYVNHPENFQNENLLEYKELSDFEIIILGQLKDEGYNIISNYSVGSYRIPILASYKNKRVAIECNDVNQKDLIRTNMEKQTILERVGWRFIQVRATEYYLNPEENFKEIIKKLNEYEIKKEENIEQTSEKIFEKTLKERVIERAKEILKNF